MSAVDAGTACAAEPVILDVRMEMKNPPIPALLKRLADEHKTSPNLVAREMFRQWFAQRMTPDEYFKFRLFDGQLSPNEKRQFIGNLTRRKIVRTVNFDPRFMAVTDNKLITEGVLRSFGFPVPRTRALFHPTSLLPSLKAIPARAALEGYLRDEAHYPMFGKPTDGINSLGAISLGAYQPATDTISLLNGRSVGVAALADEIDRNYGAGYIFQELLENHPTVREIAGNALSCVRFYTIVLGGEARVLRAVWKLPAGTAMADNFWRGNLLASLDLATGAVRRVVRGTGLAQTVLAEHPDTRRSFDGLVVPDWTETKAMVVRAAAAIPDVPLIGWDVAVTPAGGVIIETNSDPDTSLAQIADGRGILDDDLRALVAARAKAREDRLREVRKGRWLDKLFGRFA